MQKKYEKNWDSIDSRPIPEWFDKAKLGIFIHWGIYSVPAYAPKRSTVNSTGLAYSEWYGWQIKQKFAPYYDFHFKNYGKDFDYEDFAPQWKAEMFDADKWADLFSYAGAKYVVLVSKHHDAFCLWPSYYSWNWNSCEIGPHRDLVKEILDAVEKKGITRGLYYSLLEWTHPVMRRIDPENAEITKYAEEKMIPQMKELIDTYKPKILFTDGEWSYPSEKWKSLDFLTWLFNESKVKDEIVINDRWGSDCRSVHGGYFTTEYGEVNSPAINEEDALNGLSNRKWEENRSIGASFGFNRNEDISDYLCEKELIEMLVDVVCKGGNLCLNVGPNADGTISPIIQERLTQLGDWMKINGESIYESRPVSIEIITKKNVDKISEIYSATKVKNNLYIFAKKYDFEPITVNNPQITEKSKISLLGNDKKIDFKSEKGKLVWSPNLLTVDELPCRNVYVYKIEL